MATGKRYYWIKLKESFMTSDAVDFLMGQPGGANYVVLYQMLCLKTINTDGRLSRHIGEIIIPYDEQKIARDTKWFSVDTVRVALNLYKALGLVYADRDGCLVLTDHANLVGSETDWAQKKRRQATGKTPAELPPSSGESGGENFPTEIEIDIRDRDKEIEKDIETDKEEKNVEGCTAPETAAVLTLLLNDGSEYPITQDYIDKMQQLFPAVDVHAQMLKMSAWCINNSRKRKTKRGITAFINSWLSKEQDRGARNYQPAPQQQQSRAAENLHASYDMMAGWAEKGESGGQP